MLLIMCGHEHVWLAVNYCFHSTSTFDIEASRAERILRTKETQKRATVHIRNAARPLSFECIRVFM